MQPQVHVQVVMNTVDFHMNPQAALDSQWTKGKTILVETGFPQHIAQALARKGHDIQVALAPSMFGRGQIIWRDPDSGVLCAGTESRTDGSVAAWWSKYSSDFQLSPSSSILIANRFDSLYNKIVSGSNSIETFNNFVLKTGNVRGVLNSGEKTFSEYISIYENSRKFKEFIGDLPPEANLIQEYFNANNANTWAEKLPSKTIRFGLFTGAGLLIDTVGGSGAGTLLGISLSAVDTFLVDKLIKGWKPNHFIENDLKNFIDS